MSTYISDVRLKKTGEFFETEVQDFGFKVVISSVKRRGWKSAHKTAAKAEGKESLWITHIENGIVTTTWEA